MTGAWDGVPLNPGRDGWHLIEGTDGSFMCAPWNSEKQMWLLNSAAFSPCVFSAGAYLGPIISPAEHQAALDATWQAACEAMREKAVQAIDARAFPDAFEDMTAADAWDQAGQFAIYDINALPIPERPR